MRGAHRSGYIAAGLVILFLLSLIPVLHPEPVQPLSEDDFSADFEASTLGQATTLTVGSWPDGANQRVTISVPDGHAVESLGLDIKASDLSDSVATSWDEVGDFDRGSVYDGMDVNASSLKILPQDWKYDFESGAFEPEWSLAGTSNWAVLADGRLGGLQLAKAGTISHNQESRMTLDVSQLPASSGTFQYSVSSESSFDYLLFCIDNTGCSRFSGYSQRWSGTVNNAQQAFSIPANAQTLTWKYLKDGSVNSGSDTALSLIHI